MMDNDVDEDVDGISEVGRKREGMRLRDHYTILCIPLNNKYVTKVEQTSTADISTKYR